MKALTILPVFLAGCVTPPPVDAGPTAGLGQNATVNGVRIRPIEIVEDSRCPALVRCVWQGRLVLRVQVSTTGGNQLRELELGVPQAVGEYRVALIDVVPPKLRPGPIDVRAYRFTFTVTGR